MMARYTVPSRQGKTTWRAYVRGALFLSLLALIVWAPRPDYLQPPQDVASLD
jgi:hypothetical protein